MQCLRGDKEGHVMDVEAYQRLLVTARSVAVSRPHNLVKFAAGSSDSSEETEGTICIHLKFKCWLQDFLKLTQTHMP